MLVPRPDQTSGNSLVLTFSLVASFDGKALDGNGAGGLSPTPDRTECISVHEYSNSCPHFKHTSYVRLLMVNTPLRLEGGTQRTHKSCARWRCSQVGARTRPPDRPRISSQQTLFRILEVEQGQAQSIQTARWRVPYARDRTRAILDRSRWAAATDRFCSHPTMRRAELPT
jgi:hypothetical protein